MANDVKIRVTGAKQLRREAKKIIGADANAIFKEVNRDVSRMVAREAIDNVTVRTGRLRGSIKAIPTVRAARVRAGTGPLRKYSRPQGRVPHAGVHHYTVDPFFTDAVRTQGRRIRKRYKEHMLRIGKRLAKAGRTR